MTGKPHTISEEAIEAAYHASEAWLKLIDQGKYGDSWDKGAILLQEAIPKEQWMHIQEQTRKPFGKTNSRVIADKRTAHNPHGLRPGDYTVMVYKTSFSHKPSTIEIVTLFYDEKKKNWGVVTYQVN